MRILVNDCKWNLVIILKSTWFALCSMNETKLQLILVDNLHRISIHENCWSENPKDSCGVIWSSQCVWSLNEYKVLRRLERWWVVKVTSYESHLECRRLKQHHRNLIIKSKCDHLGMQISTFDVLIKTLFAYVNFIDESRKKFTTMILEARKFHQVIRHQRRIHATLNSALMSDNSTNKSQNIQWHHRQSTELINSFLR